MADPSSVESRRSGRENDVVYRRPPARPEAAAETTGSSWFSDDAGWGGAGGTADSGSAEAEQPAPEFGPGTPAGFSRISFGFTDGPISPVRQQNGLPVRSPGESAADVPPAETWSATGPAETTGGASVWPPPTRVDPPDLDRVPFTEPFAEPQPTFTDPGPRSGVVGETSGSWRIADTGERRLAYRENPLDDPQPPRPSPADAGPPRQSRFVSVGIALLGVVVLLAGGVLGVVYFSGDDGKLDSVLQLGAGGETGQHLVTAPLDNRTKASFEVLAATNRVRVSIGELGEDLYRISTPDDAGFVPRPVTRNDEVKLQVSQDGDGTGGEIEVVLAARVQWALRFSGYAEEQIIDLTGGQISELAMVGASRRTQLALSRPVGTVPVRVTAAVEELTVSSPTGNPVRVNVAAGVQKVVAGTRTLNDVPAGSTLTPKDWGTKNRYDMTAAARITNLTVESA
ncbi:MAG: hypothetical protein ABW046_01255 [Actinoplanes sp.]